MAKALANLTLFVEGNPAEATPQKAFMAYSVVDGELRKDNAIYEMPSPTWTDAANTIWDDAVAQIKTNEGIS